MTGVLRACIIICLILAGTLFSPAGRAEGGEKPDPKKVYNHNCAECHGTFGKPTKRGSRLGAPDFTSRFWQVSITDEQIIETIKYGKKKMPGWRKELTPEEIEAAAKWVRVLGKKRS